MYNHMVLDAKDILGADATVIASAYCIWEIS
jgi:hypothetical protein